MIDLFGDPGEVVNVHTETVDESLLGATCTGFGATENNSSIWPNNDLIISSGGESAVMPNFEAVAGGTTAMAGTLTLGPTIDISIRLGPGGVSSEGTLIVLNYAQPEVTTTVIGDPTTTTTTGPTTTTPAVTTNTQQTETEEGETPHRWADDRWRFDCGRERARIAHARSGRNCHPRRRRPCDDEPEPRHPRGVSEGGTGR